MNDTREEAITEDNRLQFQLRRNAERAECREIGLLAEVTRLREDLAAKHEAFTAVRDGAMADNTRLRAALRGAKDDFVSARGNVLGMVRRANEAIARIDAALAPAVEAPREPQVHSGCDDHYTMRPDCVECCPQLAPAAEASGEAAPFADTPLGAESSMELHLAFDAIDTSGLVEPAAPREDAPAPGFVVLRTDAGFAVALATPADVVLYATEREAIAASRRLRAAYDIASPAAPQRHAPPRIDAELETRVRASLRDPSTRTKTPLATPAAPPATRDESGVEATASCLAHVVWQHRGRPTADVAAAVMHWVREHGVYAPTPREAPSLPEGWTRNHLDDGFRGPGESEVRLIYGDEVEVTDEKGAYVYAPAAALRALLAGDSAPVGGGS